MEICGWVSETVGSLAMSHEISSVAVVFQNRTTRININLDDYYNPVMDYYNPVMDYYNPVIDYYNPVIDYYYLLLRFEPCLNLLGLILI